MTHDGDTSLAEGHGRSGQVTPEPRALADDAEEEWDGNADTMDALLAAVAAAPPVRLDRATGLGIPEGTLVEGTYRVLRRLGGGGMGVVYLAEHLELQRQVALKLHLGAVDSQELMRLRREARVMARLSHPNVLAVHGVGTHEGRMFIAMEYAEGGTLKTWLDAGPHGWREVVAMLAQAGRGLAAAHHVGVVHRDFKPDNVLIGADGRPRVADFGLARRSDETAEPTTGSAPGWLLLGDAHRFTVTGAVVGTPAYMSPEQFDGIEVGPSSDQFSFCVVLYEALIGRRPFPGRTTLELAEAVHTGQLQPIPPEVRIPRRVLAILARGLRPVPGERYPSMEALVDALERAHGARRRRIRWSLAGATVVAAVLAGQQVAVMTAPEPCEQAEQGLGAAWDDGRRHAVVAAWSGHDGSAADAMLDGLDAWAGDWRARRREVCEATRVRQVQSELAFTLRMACLDRMAARLDALTGELAEGSDGPSSMTLAASDLPPLEQCEDVEALDALVNRFSSDSMLSRAEQERAWSEADALLTRALTRMRLGRPGWVELAEQALAMAQQHDLVTVEAAALDLLSRDLLMRGKTEQANALVERALRLALEARHDTVATDLVLGRAEAALMAGRPDDAALHLSYFDALLTRVRRVESVEVFRRHARVLQGRIFLARGEVEAGVRELAPLVDDPGVSLDLRRTVLTALGSAYETLGQHAEAVAVARDLIELIEERQGTDTPDLVPALNNLSMARLALGELEAALQDLARAEALVTASLGPEHPYLPAILTNQGVAHRRLGQLEQARALQRRSLQLRVRLYGEEHPSLAYALDELGELARLQHDVPAARQHLDRALRLRQEGLGPDHPLVAQTLTLLGRAHLDEGDRAQAKAALERAERILGQQAGDPEERAQVALLLARATEDDDPEGAREWALRAQALAAQTGHGGEALRAEAEQWLRERSTLRAPAAPPIEPPVSP